MFILTFLILATAIIYVLLSVRTQRWHKDEMLGSFEHRIHVNGIRGKSSVTRLIAAALREADIKTVAKTTGTAARVILEHDADIVIKRKEADIAEQKRILDIYKGTEYTAAVFECMAINPLYQRFLEEKVMQSTIGVITNVREDHTDLLGETLPEIARSLSATVPHNGHLVTAETDPELLGILEEVCQKRGTQLHAVGNLRISDSHMAKFKHFEYKANVAIALKVAQLVNKIDRKTAMKGMHKALPDPGAFVLKQFDHKKKTVHWANLFAINDRESFIYTVQSLCAKLTKSTKRVVILNNRHDRPERVAQFVDIAVNSVDADYIITFGDYEKQVTKEVARHGKDVKVVKLGNSTNYRGADGQLLFDKMVESIDEKECVLFGAVNIHTPQSQELLKLLEGGYAH